MVMKKQHEQLMWEWVNYIEDKTGTLPPPLNLTQAHYRKYIDACISNIAVGVLTRYELINQLRGNEE